MTENMSPEQVLALTAARNAAARGQESARDDRLFDDPWAGALAGPEGAGWLAQAPPAATTPAVLRTRYVDDFLMAHVHDEGIRQVVILFGGLDTRAWRLDWPEGTTVFELDTPDMLERKQQLLAEAGAEPHCERIAVPSSLTGRWQEALVAAGLSRRVPALWVLEDVYLHLPPEKAKGIIDRLYDALTGGSYLLFDAASKEALAEELDEPWAALRSDRQAPWQVGLADPREMLRRLGLRAQLTDFGAPATQFGRWTFPAPSGEAGAPHVWLVQVRRPWRIGENAAPETSGNAGPGGAAPEGMPGRGMPGRDMPGGGMPQSRPDMPPFPRPSGG
jgi:methyltransferase (TIGR00027 family)